MAGEFSLDFQKALTKFFTKSFLEIKCHNVPAKLNNWLEYRKYMLGVIHSLLKKLTLYSGSSSC